MIIAIMIDLFLGLIPANLAKEKGYGDQFGIWWIYGIFLLPIAFIHALALKDKTTSYFDMPTVITVQRTNTSANHFSADELKKYKELLDSGAITQEEYEIKKRQILQ